MIPKDALAQDPRTPLFRRARWGEAVERTIEIPDFRPRVLHGMDVLDKVAPGWQEAIVTVDLDLRNPNRCVLGQTWPHYQRLKDLGSQLVPPSNYTSFVHELLAEHDARQRLRAQQQGSARNGAEQYAASIGCALSFSDYAMANRVIKKLIAEFFGSGLLSGSAEYTARVQHTLLDVSKMYYEVMTETWLEELARARMHGRWARPTIVLPPQPANQRDLVLA